MAVSARRDKRRASFFVNWEFERYILNSIDRNIDKG
jgi:hypothetical protein